jgi:hypothetical protein
MALTQVETSGLSGSGASSNSTTGNVFSQTGPFKNRIINGDMRIDQRNAGAAVTPSSSTSQYLVDRWRLDYSQTSKITAQRDTTVPSGFTNSLKLTVAAAVTPGASDYFLLAQPIEGVNTDDLAFGTASAKTITVSFKVRSSVTGTYAMAIRNGSNNRSYVGTYTISAANTFEDKIVTLTGDTTGTWATDTGSGITAIFDLGSGSNFNGTAGAWAGANYFRTSSTVNWISNAGATFYITGVQLEAGSVATPFERRSYGQELALAQRYYQLLEGFTGTSFSTSTIAVGAVFRTEMRASPTVSATAAIQITYPGVNDYTQSSANASIVSGRISARGASVACANFSGLTNAIAHVHNVSVNSAAIAFSAEL